ncbi:MAG TPA: hypothetical protein VFG68_08180 [Fimbriiglobus sp.]|nr:hypothetical protein [Fimbriiglobus sp.]
MRARRQHRKAVDFGSGVFGGSLADVHYLTPADIAVAWDVFRQFADKDWSFTAARATPSSPGSDCPPPSASTSTSVSSARLPSSRSRSAPRWGVRDGRDEEQIVWPMCR